MPKTRYDFDQLLQLRGSPLVRKPDSLPAIEQWIEQLNDPNQRRPRTQSGLQSGKNENEQPLKRPALFETRQGSRNSYQNNGEDIFLGPKISFASASAARQSSKTTVLEDRNAALPPDESRLKTDRGQGRDRNFRDRDGRDVANDLYKDKFEKSNGFHENGGSQDSRIQAGPRRGQESFGRPRPRGEDSEDGGTDGVEQKRSVGPRSRLDQPWIRGVKPEVKDDDIIGDDMNERSWRDRDRRGDKEWTRGARVEQDPQWLTDQAPPDTASHTVEDFQKWKERMKAGSTNDVRPSIIDEDTPEVALGARPATPNGKVEDGASMDLFKNWAVPKSEEISLQATTSTPKTASKPKASRFAGFFAPTAQDVPQHDMELQPEPEAEPEPQLETSPAPVFAPSQPSPVKPKSADQEGFARMMQMLRLGNTSQGASLDMFARPDHDGSQRNTATQQSAPTNHGSDVQSLLQRQSLTSPAEARGPQPPLQQPQAAKPFARPEASSRDSEFLLKLMQQQYQQPKSPFTEGQIYGQSYNRKESTDISSLLNNFTPRHIGQQSSQHQGRADAPLQLPMHMQTQAQPQLQPPPTVKSRGVPAGVFPNERAFTANQQLEVLLPEHGNNSLQQIDIRLGQPPRHVPQPQEHRFPPMQMPPFDQPHGQSNRIPEAIPPPPGFAAPQSPQHPGFFGFPGGNNPGVPHGMRGPGPMAPPGPNFFNGPVGPGPGPGGPQGPGFGPPMQAQQQQQRRMSQLGMPAPQLYEGMASGPMRRPPGMPPGMGPPPHGQYPPYLKQGNGVGY